MKNREEFIKSIFEISSPQDFNAVALNLFQYQATNLEVYQEFLSHLKVDPASIKNIDEIPCLPIRFFKSRQILGQHLSYETIFRSSGTNGSTTSAHYIHDLKLYEKSFLSYFETVHGSSQDLVILALLPSYLEREDSSLVYMVNHLINQSKSPSSGFYLNNYDELASHIEQLRASNKSVVLFGVTFALLELAEKRAGANWKHVTVIETGGMKGRGKELTRTELHQRLISQLGFSEVHSEYGMTELLSQAYSKGSLFYSPPWMKVNIREIDDPFSPSILNKTGRVTILDLANIDSCAFLSTDDLGKSHSSNSFEILGRFDHSDTRGCNLMVQDL